jgi:hypothetical protein
MPATNTTTATPTERQATLIDMAKRKRGVSRADVRDALGYGERAAIPVQSILKGIAARFGFKFITEAGEANGRTIALYRFEKKAKPAKKSA